MVEFFKIKLFLVYEQWRTILRYYHLPSFAGADLLLAFFSFFSNPYRTCRKFLQKKQEEIIHAYGETPVCEFDKLLTAAKISANDVFVEMGSGRGKLCFWVASQIGCQVRGIEWVPSFVHRATWICKLFKLDVDFEEQSMFDADLSNATVVYLYAIHLSDEKIARLTCLSEKMAKGSVLICISEAMESSSWALEQVLPMRFPWGQTEAYIQRKIL